MIFFCVSDSYLIRGKKMKKYSGLFLSLLAVLLAGCKKNKKVHVDTKIDDTELTVSNESDGQVSYEEKSDANASEDIADQASEQKKENAFFFGYDCDFLPSHVVQKIKDSYASLVSSKEEIVVYGNCDSRGSATYNMGLGARRASFVKSILVSIGVSADRIKVISLGQTILVEGDSESAYAQNRVAIIEFKGQSSSLEKKAANASNSVSSEKSVAKPSQEADSDDSDEDDEDE